MIEHKLRSSMYSNEILNCGNLTDSMAFLILHVTIELNYSLVVV